MIEEINLLIEDQKNSIPQIDNNKGYMKKFKKVCEFTNGTTDPDLQILLLNNSTD